jgi:prolyl-tRNA synthetase
MAGRPGFVVASWCGRAECEAAIKAETQATLRNIPLAEPPAPGRCVKCQEPSTAKAWFAKAY